jgi:hypothetical protein
MGNNTSNTTTSKLNNAIENINEAIGDINTALEKLDVSKKNYKNTNDSGNKNTAIPFSIENKDSILTINFNSNIGLDSFASLNLIIQGFIYVKPLRVVLNFGEIKRLPEEMLVKIDEIIKLIQSAEGEIKIVSRSQDFISLIKEKNLNNAVKVYEDLSDAVF